MRWIEWILFKIGIKLLMRSFKFMDVYSPKDEVKAITFSIDEKYIDKVQEIK